MQHRNIRRLYLAGKGLRIWRKKYAGNALSQSGLKYMYCLFYHGGYYAVTTIRLYMENAGNGTAHVNVVYTALNKLIAAGYVSRDGNGRYGLTVDGKTALNEIEKCIRNARPDR